jgi:hypothetical protein
MHSVPASCDLPNHCPTCSLGGTRTPCRRRQRTPRLPVDQKTVVQRRRGCRSAHRLFRSCRSLVIVHVIIASTVKRSARSGCAESHACTTRVCGGSRRAQLNAVGVGGLCHLQRFDKRRSWTSTRFVWANQRATAPREWNHDVKFRTGRSLPLRQQTGWLNGPERVAAHEIIMPKMTPPALVEFPGQGLEF